MTTEKRDQRAFDAVQKDLDSITLDELAAIIDELDEPYTIKPSVSGKRGYPPKSMALICMLLEFERTTYRKIVPKLRKNVDFAKLGIVDKIPSKSTIARAYKKIPEEYFEQVHKRVIEGIKPDSAVAVDSTAFSTSRYDRWRDHRDVAQYIRNWVKLHCIIDVGTRVILSYHTTARNVHDINGLYAMFESFGHRQDLQNVDFCGDAAYLARKVCNMVSAAGMTPFIDVKLNTIAKSFGSYAWKVMVTMYRENEKGWKEHYGQRSIIEAVFAAIKTMYGSSVRCRIPGNRRRELAIRVILYNIELVARHRFKESRKLELIPA